MSHRPTFSRYASSVLRSWAGRPSKDFEEAAKQRVVPHEVPDGLPLGRKLFLDSADEYLFSVRRHAKEAPLGSAAGAVSPQPEKVTPHGAPF